MVGPLDFTMNDETRRPRRRASTATPLILNQWTQPYYPALLEGAGLTKAMDLLMWEL